MEEVWNNQDSSKSRLSNQTEQSGEKGLGKRDEQEPDGPCSWAPEILREDRRNFTKPIWHQEWPDENLPSVKDTWKPA